MPRKLRFSVRKTHSDVTKGDLDLELSTSSTVSTDAKSCLTSTVVQTDLYARADQYA